MNAALRWRILDTGLLTPVQNAALDRALVEAREADEIASTLRFSRYTPSVLLAASDPGDPVLDVGACRSSGLAIHRRLTDGGTFFCDAAHLAWALYLARAEVQNDDSRRVVKRLCHAAAAGISALGCEAAWRAPNEIVVEGRTIARAGILHAEHGLMFQAVLSLDGDARERAQLHALPWKPDERATMLAERVAGLRELFGHRVDVQTLKRNLVEACESEFGMELREADLTLSEQSRYAIALREQAAGDAHRLPAGRDLKMAQAAHQRDGRTLSACVVYDAARCVRQVWFAGCEAKPSGTLPDLEAALRDTGIARIEAKVRSFFASRPAHCVHWLPDELALVVRRAVDQPLLAR